MFLNSKARTNIQAHILLLVALIIGLLAFSSCATLIEKFLSVKVNQEELKDKEQDKELDKEIEEKEKNP